MYVFTFSVLTWFLLASNGVITSWKLDLRP